MTRIGLVTLAASLVFVSAVAACRVQRGGEPIPVERRAFHETPPPPMTFLDKPDASDADAAPDEAGTHVAAHATPKKDGGTAWVAPRSGYLEQLGAEFRRLQPVPLEEYEAGHTKGRKKQVMNELGRLLVNASRDTVVRIMGRADADERPGSNRWGPTSRQDARAAERLLYQWRGWKDYLFFELDSGGRVIRSEWFLSKE